MNEEPKVIEQHPTLRETLEDWLEELRVRWFMLDAQQKQALVLLGLYVGYTLLDVAGELAKVRLKGER